MRSYSFLTCLREFHSQRFLTKGWVERQLGDGLCIQLKLAELTTPLLGIPDGHTGMSHGDGPHLCARMVAVAFCTATFCLWSPQAGGPSLRSHPLVVPVLLHSGASFSFHFCRHCFLSDSQLLEVSGETTAGIARDLWVLIETNRENTEDSRGPAFFFFFFLAIAFVTEARKGENW